MKTDPKQSHLYWRGRSAYFRIRLLTPNGHKDHAESLGPLALEDARRLVREKIKAAALGNYLERWGERRLRADVSGFPELFAAYEEYVAGARSPSPASAKNNVTALRSLVRAARGAAALEGSLAVLDRTLVIDSEAARMRGVREAAGREGWPAERLAAALETAQNTFNSTVGQARSLFKAACLASAPYRALKLPATLTAFMEQPVEGTTKKRYVPPPPEVIAAVLAGIKALRASDPAAWLAAMLEINAGARRSTAVEARWDWVRDEGRKCEFTGEPVVSLQIAVAKGGLSAPALYRSLYEEMLAARGDAGPYIVPGETPAERSKVFKRLCRKLKAMGLNAATVGRRCNPNHELRKLCTDEMYDRHGEKAALAVTGHSEAKMLIPYIARRARHALRLA